MLVQVPSTPLPIQLSALVPRKAAEDAYVTGNPATCVTDQDGVPGSSGWSRPGYWGTEPVDARSLSSGSASGTNK